MNIQQRILNALNKKNNTQKDLGFAIGVSPSTLNNWLKLGRSIPSEFLIPISEFLCVSVNWLLTGEGEMYKSNDGVQPEFYVKEKLDTSERLLLSNYKKLDEDSKVEFLNLVVLKTLETPKGKLYHSENANEAEEEIVADYELQRLVS